MKLPELQDMAKHMGIELENKESGKGKGRGFKRFKTMKQLRTEIESKRNAPKLNLIRNKKMMIQKFLYIQNLNKFSILIYINTNV